MKFSTMKKISLAFALGLGILSTVVRAEETAAEPAAATPAPAQPAKKAVSPRRKRVIKSVPAVPEKQETTQISKTSAPAGNSFQAWLKEMKKRISKTQAHN